MHIKLLLLALAIALFAVGGFVWRGRLIGAGLFFWALSTWPGID